MNIMFQNERERLTNHKEIWTLQGVDTLPIGPVEMIPQYVSLLYAIVIPLAIWSSFWKIIGLWFSARNGEKAWFIVFVIINLAGILEIYYLHNRRCWPFKPKQ
jgi:hypothetical protein